MWLQYKSKDIINKELACGESYKKISKVGIISDNHVQASTTLFIKL
jgi:hypothetical protein